MELETFTLKPQPGLKVVDPVSGEALPAEGALKPQSKYWLRRVADGDVTIVEKQKSTNKKN